MVDNGQLMIESELSTINCQLSIVHVIPIQRNQVACGTN